MTLSPLMTWMTFLPGMLENKGKVFYPMGRNSDLRP